MRVVLALLLLVPVVTPDAHARKGSGNRFPAVRLYHVNFRDEIRFNLYDSKGFPQKGPMRRLERLLRCHHTGKKHGIHWRLQQLIYKVARHFPSQRLEIVAGYRDPKVARQKGVPKSYHTRGRAVDFRVPGVANERVRTYLRTLKKVGVGYYPNSTFVHLDVRDDRGAYWVDESSPGVSKKDQKKGADARVANKPEPPTSPEASDSASSAVAHEEEEPAAHGAAGEEEDGDENDARAATMEKPDGEAPSATRDEDEDEDGDGNAARTAAPSEGSSPTPKDPRAAKPNKDPNSTPKAPPAAMPHKQPSPTVKDQPIEEAAKGSGSPSGTARATR